VGLLRDADGHETGAWTLVQDLRERASLEALSRLILQTAMDGFWIVDEALHLVEVNQAYCRMTGYSRAALLAMRVDDLDCVENERRLRERYDAVTPLTPTRHETRHRCHDGTLIDVEVSVSLLPASPRLLFAFVRDLTRQRAQEEEIVRSRQMLQAVLNHMPARVFWKDADGFYLGCNHPFAQDAGFADADDVIGHDDFEMRWEAQAEPFGPRTGGSLKRARPGSTKRKPNGTPRATGSGCARASCRCATAPARSSA
jgi:PAS domain S-box-containing protein